MLRVTLFLLACLISNNAHTLVCSEQKDSRALVETYYQAVVEKGGRTMKASMSKLMSDPRNVACVLISDLQTIAEEKIDAEQAKQPKARPIWALRALRYLTNCTDYRGALVKKVEVDPADTRWSLLLRDGIQTVPYFRTWMSRDLVVLAPVEVQEQVIAAWKDWYARTNSSFRFYACTDIEDWYY